MGYYKLDNDKWRVNVSMKGQRLTKVVDTEDDAKETEKDFKQQLLDGKPVNKIRANKQITLSLAFENTNNNPDQFAICNFRENTLSVQQVAFNTYKLSITIDEVA